MHSSLHARQFLDSRQSGCLARLFALATRRALLRLFAGVHLRERRRASGSVHPLVLDAVAVAADVDPTLSQPRGRTLRSPNRRLLSLQLLDRRRAQLSGCFVEALLHL